MEIILSEEQEQITGKLLKEKGITFLTGRAGTGKTTIIKHFRQRYNKNLVVLAPTGVASLNINATTIHRFFRFGKYLDEQKFNEIPKEADEYKAIDCIIIDEISMVRSDLLDYIDKFLQVSKNNQKPFGGIKMIFVGDLYQLPPVVESKVRTFFREVYDSELFFSSNVLQQNEYKIYELTNIYRQKDIEFINILNAIRNDKCNEKMLEILNQRFSSNNENNSEKFSITLCSRRSIANQINLEKLKELENNERIFIASINGKVEHEDYPTTYELKLKVGCQVMLVSNDASKQWVNGSMGKVLAFIKKDIELVNDKIEDEYYQEDDLSDKIYVSKLLIQVQLENGSKIEVDKESWEISEPAYDRLTKKIIYKQVGTFIQYPIILAWATSIHKSQGKTFNNVIIELAGGLFASGQLYVGLSRCTSLSGLTLKQKIELKHIKVDWRVSKYFINYYIKQAEKLLSYEAKKEIILKCIQEKLNLTIKYINKSNEISNRTIIPKKYYKCEFRGNSFNALDAFDSKRQEIRTFQISRILNISNLEEISSKLENISNLRIKSMAIETIEV